MTDLTRSALDHIQEGCLVVSPEQRYVYVNASAAAQLQVPPEALLGKRVGEVRPDLQLDDVIAVLRQCLEDKSPRRLERQYTRADGQQLWFDIRFQPVPEGVSIVSRDISHRKRAERELRLFRELMDQSSDGFEIIDPDTGRILVVNERDCKDSGYTQDELVGMYIWELDPGINPARFAQHSQRAQEEGALTWRSVHRRKDGSTFPVEVRINAGRLDRTYLVAVVRDISDQLAAEQALCRGRDTQQAIASILRLSLDHAPLDVLLKRILHTILSVPWLSLERRGAIMLVDHDPELLVMHAQIGLDEDTLARCAQVPIGSCLCGRVALSGQALHTGLQDPRHEPRYPEVAPHGHSCLPIVLGGVVLGVLNTYLAPGHRPSQGEQEFLATCADTLAGIVARKHAEQERQQIEEQLRAAQRLEAVGRLAGGVAHDFNNLLSVIIGYSTFALDELPQDAPAREDITVIQSAGQRAAVLTRQLLAFSRKQVLRPEVLCLNQVVAGLEPILRRLLGEDIEIEVKLDPNLGTVRADPGQVEQVLMNLVLNARDAMPVGGRLTLETRNLSQVEPAVLRVGAHPRSPWVMLSVSDTGLGMDADTRQHIFEPFFTTKDKDKGTGLGLSTVYGIIAQSGGTIRVHSEAGQGTRFEVLLPRADEAAAAAAPAPTAERQGPSQGQGQVVLVVEDEDEVRALVTRMLRQAGYHVLLATTPDEAVQQVVQHGADIALLLTDVVMPLASGPEVAAQLRALVPTLKTLYMSGYSEEAVLHQGIPDPGTHFLGKPFSAADLGRKVREVLDYG